MTLKPFDIGCDPAQPFFKVLSPIRLNVVVDDVCDGLIFREFSGHGLVHVVSYCLSAL
jgi:hypothetical protein